MVICIYPNKLKEMNKINNKCLKILKQISTTQLLSIVFAIIGELYLQLLISYHLASDNILLLSSVGIIFLTVLYTSLIYFFLEGKWMNIPLIFIPHVIYFFIIFIKSPYLFPMQLDPNDYGGGILLLFVTFCQCMSVLISSIVGTYLNKERCKPKVYAPVPNTKKETISK
ncbi:hypothetical protein [Clostridium algidicarnis]|uniref:hypothetical protein n=2 Tax=Clostridium algidicarnis TaxID=37659 RepID=UPI00055D0527|nr:hypothetical protein [Clostridium algidicarnis]